MHIYYTSGGKNRWPAKYRVAVNKSVVYIMCEKYDWLWLAANMDLYLCIYVSVLFLSGRYFMPHFKRSVCVIHSKRYSQKT